MVSRMKKTCIIAEAGVNHNGSLKLAKMLAKKAKESNADYVKFQTYKTENLVTYNAQKAEYQIQNTKNNDSQYDMLKKLELSYNDFEELKTYCDEIGIKFLSTPFDIESIEFLKTLGMDFWKIPSGEVTNLPYLEKISMTGMPVILSTGMCTTEEIEAAIKILQSKSDAEITVLHCTTEYPAPLGECNLNVIDTLRDKFHVNVGYSDHTEGILVPLVAVAKGAKLIEKHFTLDKNMEGPDHKASLEPQELKEMIENIRKIELILGNNEKHPTESEKTNMKIARKSIVAKCDINKGDLFTVDNLDVKRPGDGISPMRWYDVVGRVAKKDFRRDEMIEL